MGSMMYATPAFASCSAGVSAGDTIPVVNRDHLLPDPVHRAGPLRPREPKAGLSRARVPIRTEGFPGSWESS
ncbi:hypothetical protein SUDANB67_03624 [Nocardiopsis dassonvillei]|uniref:Uncharacterized protein n=1 Tax=Nocardiopsis dassonvillei (strain ATCC 23218 / DSM 43111 / CIP 107115 / JCM 7437 / KCTC 9190 / NBRC 14626 / NCTC 10488 / NRRL B-5397 / IMRU 509) TaxID=446468 RepID=D7B9M7_NOCDD|nr:hypothetical protein Ndas_5506 [Nocardiopsis dassonvillei subsp. dassonvillei DSM 43111]